MGSKTNKELGFSMNEVDENTILIEGVMFGKVSKKARIKNEREFSKVSLHLFDKDYIEKLQKIEIKIVTQDKDIKVRLIESICNITRLLMR